MANQGSPLITSNMRRPGCEHRASREMWCEDRAVAGQFIALMCTNCKLRFEQAMANQT